MNPLKSRTWGIVWIFLLAPLALAAQYKDHDLGFQITVPEKWKQIPISAKEQWIVAKYISNREYQTKKDSYMHTPEMQVIVFPSSVVKNRGVEAKEDDKGGLVLKIKNPYSDFKAYLKDNASGGFFISKEEEKTINGIKTTCLEIKYEKNTVPRKQLAWVFHGPDADWAVTFEALEDYAQKLVPEFEKSLRTFKLFERKGSLVPEVRTGNSDNIDIADPRKQTPEQKAKKRAEAFEAELKIARSRLPEGWSEKRSKNFIALTHVDEKYTQRILDQAEGVRSWLEENFAWIGAGKPGLAILRICDGWDEYNSFANTSDDSWGRGSYEIVTCKNPDLNMGSNAIRALNGGVLRIWFFYRNDRLSWGLPAWLNRGLTQSLSTVNVRNGKLDFRLDDWERQELREMVKTGKIVSPQKLLTSTYREASSRESWLQSGAMIRFLMSGKFSKGKEFVTNYIKILMEVLAEEEAKELAKEESETQEGEKKPKTEEEEEALFKERKQREKNRVQEIFDRTFGTWTSDDWQSFEKSFLDSVS